MSVMDILRGLVFKMESIRTLVLAGFFVSLIHCLVDLLVLGPGSLLRTSLPVTLILGVVALLTSTYGKKGYRYAIYYPSPEGKTYYILFDDKNETSFTESAESATTFRSKNEAREAAKKVELVPREKLQLVTLVIFEDKN